MDHVVASIADAPQVALPVLRVLSHELTDDGEYRQRRQWKRPAIEREPRGYIDVVDRRLLRLGAGRAIGLHKVVCEVWELGIGRVKRVRAGVMDRDGDLKRAVEVGDQSAGDRYVSLLLNAVHFQLQRRSGSRPCALELAELVPLKRCAMLGDVDPKAPVPADARGALDREADRYGIARLGGDVDVLAGNLRRAIVVQGQQVDLV